MPDASHEDEEMDPDDPFGENQQALTPGLAGFAPPAVMMAAGLMRQQMMPFAGQFGMPFGLSGMGAPMVSGAGQPLQVKRLLTTDNERYL